MHSLPGQVAVITGTGAGIGRAIAARLAAEGVAVVVTDVDLVAGPEAVEHISPWEQKIYSRLLFDQDLIPGDQILEEVDRRWGDWKALAALYLFEDLFWRRTHEPVPWLEKLIRL